MSERYIARGTAIIDTHVKGDNTLPEGKVVAYADVPLVEKLVALLNEDIMVTELIKGYGGNPDDFIDDVVRHTKVQQ